MDVTIRIDPADEIARSLVARLAERGMVVDDARKPGTTLVLGGARSGKSSWAEAQLAGAAAVDYIATSEVGDDAEWAERVALHRARRPTNWRTVETLDLAAVLANDSPRPVLIDCAALWLDRVLADAGVWDDAPGWQDRLEEAASGLVRAVAETTREVIIVSNEVGSGVVPATASGRLYRDELGRLNARLAGACASVFLLTAGLPTRLK